MPDSLRRVGLNITVLVKMYQLSSPSISIANIILCSAIYRICHLEVYIPRKSLLGGILYQGLWLHIDIVLIISLNYLWKSTRSTRQTSNLFLTTKTTI